MPKVYTTRSSTLQSTQGSIIIIIIIQSVYDIIIIKQALKSPCNPSVFPALDTLRHTSLRVAHCLQGGPGWSLISTDVQVVNMLILQSVVDGFH